MRSRIVYSFTARIYRGNGKIVDYEKTLPGEGTFTSLTSIENYIKQCENRRLDLDNAEVRSRVYLPPTHAVSTPGVYQGRVEFSRIIVRVVHSNEPLMGCGLLPEWLRSKKSIHAIDDKNDNLCVWRCLAIYLGYQDGVKRPAENTTRRTLKLAREFYDDPKLKVEDVRGTKSVDFEGIGKMFTVNIRLHELKEQKIWKLVFGKHQFKKSLPSVAIGLYEGHCFYSKYIEMLTEHWECVGCQQRFTKHDNHTLHITEYLCSGGKTKLIRKGKKIKLIMNSSEKVFYGGNTQFSYIDCKWIEKPSEKIGKHTHHALCGHGGEKCMKINKKEILVMVLNLKLILFINFMIVNGTDALPQTEMVIDTKKQSTWKLKLKIWGTMSFRYGSVKNLK